MKQIKLGDLPKSELRMIEVNTSPTFPCFAWTKTRNNINGVESSRVANVLTH